LWIDGRIAEKNFPPGEILAIPQHDAVGRDVLRLTAARGSVRRAGATGEGERGENDDRREDGGEFGFHSGQTVEAGGGIGEEFKRRGRARPWFRSTLEGCGLVTVAGPESRP